MTEVLHVGAFSTCVCQPDKHAMFDNKEDADEATDNGRNTGGKVY